VRTIPVAAYPSDLAVTGDAVYVASGPLADIVRIEPGANRASEPQAVASGCGGVEASIVAGEGSLWLACQRAPDAVRVKISPPAVIRFAYRAGLLTSSSSSVVPHFSAIAYGENAIWLADRAQGRVIQIDPATNVPLRAITVGRDPVALAVGFGSLWVAGGSDGTVTRFRLGAGRVPGSPESIEVGKGPVDLAAGEGAVWVANAGDRTVSRIDPGRNRVTDTVALGHAPAGIATGRGRVWVTVGRA
jgi:YVTN family beta-propeller protein